MCGLVEERHVDVPDLTAAIGAFSFRFSGGFGERVADVMERRGTKQSPLSIAVGGRPALAYDWTDGVAHVYSAFVALDAASGVAFEFSWLPAAPFPTDVEEMGRAFLDTVHWLERLQGAS